ncbi:glycosyltransferase family 39 protein, partial [Candidatus Parcubacteria bacterium]|nr:glycosyltransferase family 39 protein [Candidatus Parcubacteria bacterium]
MITILAIFSLTLLGGWLRFRGLAAEEFWYDEAFSALLVRRDWGEMLALITQDLHPPLYYIGLKLWAGIFGYADSALRFFSAVLGVLLVFIVYRFTIKLFKNRAKALMASFIFAINPFFIQYSQETRPYALLAVLIL